jgi:glucosamine-6-phosphate deaminase
MPETGHINVKDIHRHSETHGTEGTQLERIPVLIFDDPGQLELQVARRVANLVEERTAAGRRVVLGLPTGSTPIGVYRQLVRMHREEGLDFSNVVTFNLDEYYPIEPASLQSYHRFMHENLFDHVNIPSTQIHIPRGDVPRDEIETYCMGYEHAIQKAGGIDLMLLGIGKTGHIGFNEPGSGLQSRTRMVVLDEITRKDAASDFFGEDAVPREAITMGVGTIMDAREIILIATGEHKGPILRRTVEEAQSIEVTASFLQAHRDAMVYADEAAAEFLTRMQTPWAVMPVEWTPDLTKRAVIWLSEQTGKALMRLEPHDFHGHYLHGLAAQWPHTDALCRSIFEDLRQRIRYEEALPRGERVIVFSPHPDDDVISMGGMLSALVRNGNDVTVAYMTNGSVAVFDADVRRYLQFMELGLPAIGVPDDVVDLMRSRSEEIRRFLAEKAPGEVDIDAVQHLKAFIRYSEAIAGIEVMGLGAENARFLDLPFYRTGRVRKEPVGEADIRIVHDLLAEIRPSHIFVAGDLSDPHGTHRVCYNAVAHALEEYRSEVGDEAPLVWLYRGAWQEWEVDRVDVFLPMTKASLDRKIEAIFKHESQKDRAMFPGAHDPREFWERARDRNQQTAEALNRLGLPEFHAVEAYVTVREM